MKFSILIMIFLLTGCAAFTAPLNGLEEKNLKQSFDTSLEKEGSLSNEKLRWIEQSCSRSLGPSLWQSVSKEKLKLLSMACRTYQASVLSIV